MEDASHELRTPIAIVEGHLAMLSRWGKRDPDILDESLYAALQELTRLKNLTQELLSLSNVESMKVDNSFKPYDPIRTFNTLINDISLLHAEFIFEADLHALEGIQLTLPEHHWKQLILILLDNAIKYSGSQRLIVIKGFTPALQQLKLQIIDFGIGIPAAELPYVFDRFYRVDKARSRTLGGRGLGLAIAKRLVDTYRGTIEIESREDEGTIVTLTLPLAVIRLPEKPRQLFLFSFRLINYRVSKMDGRIIQVVWRRMI